MKHPGMLVDLDVYLGISFSHWRNSRCRGCTKYGAVLVLWEDQYGQSETSFTLLGFCFGGGFLFCLVWVLVLVSVV